MVDRVTAAPPPHGRVLATPLLRPSSPLSAFTRHLDTPASEIWEANPRTLTPIGCLDNEKLRDMRIRATG